jgi:excisionase family DNA binding protein
VDDGITVEKAAQRLQTTVQTVRAMARDHTLAGTKVRGAWSLDPASVDDFLATEGPLRGGRRHRSAESRQQAELKRLRGHIAELTAAHGNTDVEAVLRERDELRERVVALEDVVARLRDVADLQRQAEDERSQVVAQLTTAVAAAERSEQLRRKSVELLEDGLVGSLVPGRPPTPRG